MRISGYGIQLVLSGLYARSGRRCSSPLHAVGDVVEIAGRMLVTEHLGRAYLSTEYPSAHQLACLPVIPHHLKYQAFSVRQR